MLNRGCGITCSAHCLCSKRSKLRTEQCSKSSCRRATKKELTRQISNIGLCMKREAQSSSLNRVDLETAARAVVARCAGPRSEHRNYMSTRYPGNQRSNWADFRAARQGARDRDEQDQRSIWLCISPLG